MYKNYKPKQKSIITKKNVHIELKVKEKVSIYRSSYRL